MKLNDWESEYQAEIEHAISAREKGNEGMARVCARRAAGIILKAYFETQEIYDYPESSYDRLRLFVSLPTTPIDARELANLFMLQVNFDHKLPPNVDLIREVQRMKEMILPG
jgi:hypothetical protein